ncbi:MAG: cold shock and DUF1294 domain-containing protein [Hyphomicrobiaceae bacterium]|nr:cold shock and DUF1294 domain-containing protein [Hyphomicrobiaceae bacterium]MCC0024059.1 cold shock and DUF1294 domain-containing protein [Hyphomicrobiaceae bacterium]
MGRKNHIVRNEAELLSWNEQRGFGFARLPGGTERIFVHAKSFLPDMPRPQPGDRLDLEVVPGKGGKPAARDVRILLPDELPSSPLSLHLATAAILTLLLQIDIMLDRMPGLLASLYVLMGGLSLFAYSWDKQAAVLGAWRVRERDLQIIDFMGGIIGGLVAQHMMRHKRYKNSFQNGTLVAVVFHAALLGAIGLGLFHL